MDVRLVLASDLQRIQKRFNTALFNVDYASSYNIAPGDNSFIITSNNPGEISKFDWGIQTGKGNTVPFVRTEGDRNKTDDINYAGSKAIFLKPEYKQLIRS